MRVPYSNAPGHQLPPGLIFEIARAGGIVVPEKGAKRPIHCPFHPDGNASAFLSERNVFYCSVCTPEGGWSAKRFAAAIGQPWGGCKPSFARPVTPPNVDERPTFTPQDARLVWSIAQARARDQRAVAADSDVYAYLAARGILDFWKDDAFGVLAVDSRLPKAVAWWPGAGYRIVVPLYDARGEIATVQARSIVDRAPKTMFPSGSRSAGTAFVSLRALELLRSTSAPHDVVILGEGLTDYLALSAAMSVPVLCAPGTGSAARCVGPWARGKVLVIALDLDDAGEAAVVPAARAAYAHGARDVLRVEWPTSCKDACDVVKLRGLAGLEALLAKYLEVARV